MKQSALKTNLERLSFFLWIVFTIGSISLAGVGLEGMLFAAYLVVVSSTEPVHFPVAMVVVGVIGVFLSMAWRQFGIDHFHYLLYDSVISSEAAPDAPSRVLENLIREVRDSAGDERMEARVRAKTWLVGHVSSLGKEDVLLARAHLGYLLPAGWGAEVLESAEGED